MPKVRDIKVLNHCIETERIPILNGVSSNHHWDPAASIEFCPQDQDFYCRTSNRYD